MTFTEWNNAYIKLLQKRNKAEHTAFCDPCPKNQAKYEKAEAAVKAWRDLEDRPASAVMVNLIKREVPAMTENEENELIAWATDKRLTRSSVERSETDTMQRNNLRRHDNEASS